MSRRLRNIISPNLDVPCQVKAKVGFSGLKRLRTAKKIFSIAISAHHGVCAFYRSGSHYRGDQSFSRGSASCRGTPRTWEERPLWRRRSPCLAPEQRDVHFIDSHAQYSHNSKPFPCDNSSAFGFYRFRRKTTTVSATRRLPTNIAKMLSKRKMISTSHARCSWKSTSSVCTTWKNVSVVYYRNEHVPA